MQCVALLTLLALATGPALAQKDKDKDTTLAAPEAPPVVGGVGAAAASPGTGVGGSECVGTGAGSSAGVPGHGYGLCKKKDKVWTWSAAPTVPGVPDIECCAIKTVGGDLYWRMEVDPYAIPSFKCKDNCVYMKLNKDADITALLGKIDLMDDDLIKWRNTTIASGVEVTNDMMMMKEISMSKTILMDYGDVYKRICFRDDSASGGEFGGLPSACGIVSSAGGPATATPAPPA